jgi:murein DD-endopeptidase MepM/ murein hydrolase activator NlpD
MTTEVNAINSDNSITKSALSYENQMLRNNYKKLEERIINIENQIISINEYDKYIYSQILGLNIDSTEMNNYFEKLNYDSVSMDSIFIMLDERTIFTSKIVSDQLNNLIVSKDVINKNKNVLNLYPNQTPIRTKDIIEITSGFGLRKHPIYKTPIFHEGVDIAAKPNTKVYSSMSGKVVEIKYSKFGYGNKIVIKNSAGFEILFAHLSNNIYVKKNQIVTKGQLIATTGNTGTSTGPHLHYEIRKQDKLKDPLGYFYTHLTNELIANK